MATPARPEAAARPAAAQPGDRVAVTVDGAPREGVVVRVRGEGPARKAYVKYDAGGALYRCAWVPADGLAPA
jgi:hypothetical protein